jgi:hypothetical protein
VFANAPLTMRSNTPAKRLLTVLAGMASTADRVVHERVATTQDQSPMFKCPLQHAELLVQHWNCRVAVS